MKTLVVVIVFVLTMQSQVSATTWYPEEKECPLCKAKNTYYVIGSYGTYIYSWPEKYQYFFWPLTDSECLYSCPKCKFTAFMWDFDDLPGNTYDTLRSYLETVDFDKKYKNYVEIPMYIKLEIAEHIYQILWRDNEFWCRFYRVMGYHYERMEFKANAYTSRIHALTIARQMLNDTTYRGKEKETLLIIAAMHNYTDHKDSCLYYLDKARQFTYTNSAWEEENSKGLDDYLTQLIQDYIMLINEED
jgi:hypothetical protein